MTPILYTDGYKYQLAKDYVLALDIRPAAQIVTPYIALDLDGTLTIRAGYAWDGPSGPTIDTANFMRGSLVHDALYQLLRERYLPAELREAADRILQRCCLEDGMSRLRAWWVYWGVRLGGGPAADPAHTKPILSAPRKELMS
ncbi:MAG: DUF1353 domain-containing protein [Candidatus Methylomirabilales bacterium]